MQGRSHGVEQRILVYSRRPAVVEAVVDAAGALDPPPDVAPFHLTDEAPGRCLILVDVAEPTATHDALRAKAGDGPRLVALIDSAWIDRLGEALGGEWFDYLFYPITEAELRLVWQRHHSVGRTPDLSIDVDEGGKIRLVSPSSVAYQRPAVDRVVEACRHLGELDVEAAFRLRVAVGEAVANAILYGNEEDPSRFVTIEATADPDRVEVLVADEGSGFDPGSVPDPTTPVGIGRSRGRGLLLLRSLMDEVRFNEVGNAVTLVLHQGEGGRTHERRARRQRMLAELEVARDLQLRLLPRADAFADLAEIVARCEPALSLGGDFYYLVRLPEGRLGVMLGDVSSHGPSAALIMALTLSAAAVVARDREEPEVVLAEMQRQLLQALESTEMYMTLFYGVLDPRAGWLRFANAGHPFAFRAGPTGLTDLPVLDLPIGMSSPTQYKREEVAWAAGGDTLLLFTDGLCEDFSGPPVADRLERLFEHGERSPASLVAALFSESDRTRLRLDDRTAVAVRP